MIDNHRWVPRYSDREAECNRGHLPDVQYEGRLALRVHGGVSTASDPNVDLYMLHMHNGPQNMKYCSSKNSQCGKDIVDWFPKVYTEKC